MIKSPSFWERPLPFYGRIFFWLSNLYGWAVTRRFKRISPIKVSVPVICVGNLTLGGTGKTPVALALGEYFLKKGKKIGFLSRGYGGQIKGPLRVNTQHHSAQQVGDEPLLLARAAPTWVAHNRVLGAKAMINKGINLIIMDDGHQNPFLYKDISIVVVDGLKGFGNKEVFPLGPLREPLKRGLDRADAVVVVRPPSEALKEDLTEYKGHLILADLVLHKKGLPAQKVVAFCGIGNPEKFFSSLEEEGIEIIDRKAFPDHYSYSMSDLRMLRKQALEHQALLVTTEKDWVRLNKRDQKDIIPVRVELYWKEWIKMEQILEKKIPK